MKVKKLGLPVVLKKKDEKRTSVASKSQATSIAACATRRGWDSI